MHVLAVLSSKGGVGKGLCSRSFAVAALQDGLSVGLIDADVQASVMAWARRRPHPAPTVVAAGEKSIPQLIAGFRKAKADLVVVDTPPHAAPLINLAAQSATACLIVTSTGIEDLEAIGATVQIVRSLKKPAAIIINKASRNATLGLARAALGTFGLPICPVAISQLVGHQYSAAEGLTITEREPSSKAAIEIDEAYAWLKKEGII